MKLSIVIPYKQRLQNVRLLFEALAHQSMARSDFEVVVGAMEYAEDYVTTCREFTDRITIVSVLSSDDFDIPRARNMAMRQARGEVIVQMDADTLLPPDALRNLYERHFAAGQSICVVGQVVGYGNNEDGDVSSVEDLPYARYAAALDEMTRMPGWPADPRFQVEHVIPWAFGWTGLIALPAATVRAHDLFFDESFRGWGVDDLEWSYRICASGTPIVLCPDVYALHLPHVRDAEANRVAATANFHRFLRKWPAPDVEIAQAFCDLEANRLHLDYQQELRGVGQLSSALGKINGIDTVVIGIRSDHPRFDDPAAVETLPLAGLGLPYDDESIAECRVLPAIFELSVRFRDAALAEAARIAKTVTHAV